MEPYISFLMQHWMLSVAFILILIAIILFELYSQSQGPKRLNPSQVVLLINQDNAVVIDLRDRALFSKGHIVNSKNILNTELERNISKLEDHKNSPIILVGHSDQQAIKIAEKLQKDGFNDVRFLFGGIKAWTEANLPLETK